MGCITGYNIKDGVTGFNLQRKATIVQCLQGPPGSPGAAGGTTVTRIADTALSGHRVVKAVAGGKVGYPRTSVPQDGALIEGITTGAASSGAEATVQISGEMQESSWNWSLGPVFCDDNGVLTQPVPLGAWLRQVAVAVAPDVIIIDFQPLILTP